MPIGLYLSLVNIVFWLIMCFGVAYAVRHLPRRLYNHANALFRERKFERKLLKAIGTPHWKNILPEWGKVLGFEKRHLGEISPNYLDRFIKETYYAEIGHILMLVLGFLDVLVNPRQFFHMALTMALINVFVQLPFILIQRYNRPRLVKVKEIVTRKSSSSFA